MTPIPPARLALAAVLFVALIAMTAGWLWWIWQMSMDVAETYAELKADGD